MRYTVIVGCLAATLVGCASHRNDYLKDAKSAPRAESTASVQIEQDHSYYTVPAVSANADAPPPSMVPPGSNLERFNKQAPAHLSPVVADRTDAHSSTPVVQQPQKPLGALSVDATGEQRLVLRKKMSQAWTGVREALHQTPYQILDQDSSIGSYYVLDVKSTNNKVTKATPIYRVFLKPDGSNTDVVLLDKENHPADPKIAARILTAIKDASANG